MSLNFVIKYNVLYTFEIARKLSLFLYILKALDPSNHGIA